MKKKHKLKKDEIAHFDLDDSRDSSMSSGYSDDADHQMIIHHPDQPVREIDFELSKKVIISKKVYNNFLGPVLGEEGLFDPPLEDLRETISKPDFEEIMMNSLNNTLKTFKALKQAIDNRALKAQRDQRDKFMQSSRKIEFKIPNKNVDGLLETLQKSLEESIE